MLLRSKATWLPVEFKHILDLDPIRSLTAWPRNLIKMCQTLGRREVCCVCIKRKKKTLQALNDREERDATFPAQRPLFMSQLGLIKLFWHSGTFRSASLPAQRPGRVTALRHRVGCGLIERGEKNVSSFFHLRRERLRERGA